MTIWHRIKLWLNSSSTAKTTLTRPRGTDVRLESTGPGSSLGALDLEREFIGLLLGTHSFVDIDLNDLERKALKAMESVNASDLAESSLVPHLPAIVLDLFNYANTGAGPTQELIRRIKQDQILIKEILRAANTPYYRKQGVVENLEQALAALGHDTLRQLVAQISLKPVFNLRSGHFGPLAATRLWVQSERCAIACDCLAKQMHADVFTAFLAGLTSNTGLYLGARLLDKVSDGTQSPHSIIFRQRFVRQSRLLSVKIARHWKFDNAVVETLTQQADAEDVDNLDLAGSVLYAGEKLSQLSLLVEAGHLKNDFSRFACRLSGTLMDNCSLCYRELEKYSSI